MIKFNDFRVPHVVNYVLKGDIIFVQRDIEKKISFTFEIRCKLNFINVFNRFLFKFLNIF